MLYSKECLQCGKEFTFAEESIEALSQTEQMLCAKEGLDFASLVKTTCSHCDAFSLSRLKDLKLLDDASSLTASDPPTQQSDMQSQAAETRQPETVTGEKADNLQPSDAQPSAVATTKQVPVRIDGFIVFKGYNWPDCCVCCGDRADTVKKLTTYFDVGAMEKLGVMGDSSQILSTLKTAAKRIGNIEVKPNSPFNIKMKVPYCSHCRRHDRWANGYNTLLGIAV